MGTEIVREELLAIVKLKNRSKDDLHRLGSLIKGRYGTSYDVKVDNDSFQIRIHSNTGKNRTVEFDENTFQQLIGVNQAQIRTDITFPKADVEELKQKVRESDTKKIILSEQLDTLKSENLQLKTTNLEIQTKLNNVTKDRDNAIELASQTELVAQTELAAVRESKLTNGHLLVTIAKSIKESASKIDDASLINLDENLEKLKTIGIDANYTNIEDIFNGIDDEKLKAIFRSRTNDTQLYEKALKEHEEAKKTSDSLTGDSNLITTIRKLTNDKITDTNKVIKGYETKLEQYVADSKKVLSGIKIERGIKVEGDYQFLLYANQSEFRLYLPVNGEKGKKLAETIVKSLNPKLTQDGDFWKATVSSNTINVVNSVEKNILRQLKLYGITGRAMRDTRFDTDLEVRVEEDDEQKLEPNDTEKEAIKTRIVNESKKESYEKVKNLFAENPDQIYRRTEISDLCFASNTPRHIVLSILERLREEQTIVKIGTKTSKSTVYVSADNYGKLYEEKVLEIIRENREFKSIQITKRLRNDGYMPVNRHLLSNTLRKLIEEQKIKKNGAYYSLKSALKIEPVTHVESVPNRHELNEIICEVLKNETKGLSTNAIIQKIQTNYDYEPRYERVRVALAGLIESHQIVANGKFSQKLRYLVHPV